MSIDKNYFAMIKNPKKEKNLPKFVKDIDIDKMFMIPDTRNPIGQRNLLIIRMLYATGVRVSELVNICIKDIDIKERLEMLECVGNPYCYISQDEDFEEYEPFEPRTTS